MMMMTMLWNTPSRHHQRSIVSSFQSDDFVNVFVNVLKRGKKRTLEDDRRILVGRFWLSILLGQRPWFRKKGNCNLGWHMLVQKVVSISLPFCPLLPLFIAVNFSHIQMAVIKQFTAHAFAYRDFV